MAPEVVKQDEGYDLSADVWSLGITAIEISDGYVPHHEMPSLKVLMLIVSQPAPSLSRYYGWSPEFISFVDDCLIKNPERRINS